ncbi:MAG: S8 family serine peptidase [Verrucomicrobia bacterium]|nr:S8 family serine peptidase [Verrucomicrobiota bacterium]
MKNVLPQLAALALGAACAALLLGMWVSDRDSAQRLREARAAAAPAEERANRSLDAAAAAGPLDALALSPEMLAALQQLMTRADSRAREAILTFKDDAGYRRFLARANEAGLVILDRLDGLRHARVGYDTLSALERELRQHAGDYATISANYTMGIPPPPPKEARDTANLVGFANRALDYLGATGDRSAWGRGVTIAVIDTGIMPDPTFGDGRVRYYDLGFGVAAGQGAEDGHGTAVAAVAAGAANDAPGIAPGANLLSLRVTDATGTSDLFTVSRAILAATDSGAKVINISLGGYATSATLDAAIDYATSRGCVIVAAAGNDQAAQLAWPAADPRVVSVGAVDALGQQVTFSNSGPQLSLTAPGFEVQTAWLGARRALVDGTSVSAPFVSGAVAAVLSQDPSLTAQQAARVVMQTASEAGLPGSDPDFGHGILNVGLALNRRNPAYADTAIASQYYDPATKQMNIVVQNRGAQPVAGLWLDINTAGTVNSQLLSPLASGETAVVKVPVDPAMISSASPLRIATELRNPLGLNDRNRTNNRRASTLTAPGK